MSIRLFILFIGILVLIGIEGKPVAKAATPSDRVKQLLDLTFSEKKFNELIHQMLASNPNLPIPASKMETFIKKFLPFQLLREDMVKIYQDLYTVSDINGMIKFYSSALGKKVLDKQVQEALRVVQAIQTRFSKQMPQMMAWFQSELGTP